MEAQGYVEKEYMALQGIYTGKYDTLINVPMAIAQCTGYFCCAKSDSSCDKWYEKAGSQ